MRAGGASGHNGDGIGFAPIRTMRAQKPTMTLVRFASWLWAAAFLGLVGSAAAGQEPCGPRASRTDCDAPTLVDRLTPPPGLGERIVVRYVEAYAGVYRGGRPQAGFDRSDFRVYEDGVEQTLLRFEPPSTEPFRVVILIDESESMKHRLGTARAAALRFIRQGLRSQDRIAVVAFRHRARLLVDFTNDVERLRDGLKGLDAKGATSLYDALAFGLELLSGATGRRALLLFSDGRDEGSELDFDAARERARHAGVLIYPVGLAGPGRADVRRRLTLLADETGGQSFFIHGVAALVPIYGSIAKDLGLRYLLAYQSTNTRSDGRYRELKIEVTGANIEVRAMRGYYP